MDFKIPKKLNKFYIKKVCPIFYKIKQIKYRNKVIIISTIALTLIYLLFGRESVFISKNTIKRSKIGDATQNYTLYVTSDKSLKNAELNFDVNAKRITSEEADEYFYKLFDSILPEILNGNTDFLEIKTKLNLKSKYQNGISANWNFSPKINNREYILKYSNLIDGFGNVNNDNFVEGEEVEGALNVYFSIEVADSENDAKYKSDNYSIDVKVVKRDETEAEKLMKDIKKDIDNQNNTESYKNTITLPSQLNDEKIRYTEKADFSFIYIIILGIVVCFILDYRDKDLKCKAFLKISSKGEFVSNDETHS